MPEAQNRFSQFVEGAILGLTVGDALGVPAEFMPRSALRRDPVCGMRSGGAHGQRAGTWSDDTSMTLCTMDSIIEAGIDYHDQMRSFAGWLWNGSNTAHGQVFDVGGTTKHAIFQFVKGVPPLECGERGENTCGNGSLMRIVPTSLYIVGRYGNTALDARAAALIHSASICTHAHPRCQMACGIYSSVIFQLCTGEELHTAVKNGVSSALAYYRKAAEFSGVYPEFTSLTDIMSWKESQVYSTGYVLHTLQAALWCLLTTSDYAACVLKAVNLGEDTDTTAEVAGGLAGLWYGAEAIPREWAETTAKYEEIRTLSRRFAHACLNHTQSE